MTDLNEAPREWVLTWARKDSCPPEMLHPLADDYADIGRKEVALGMPVGTPVLVGPDGNCDVRLTKFFLSPHFSRLRLTSKKSYAQDLRLWIEYLDSRGRDWSQATPDDVNTFWLWRSRRDLNENAVGGSKANRELAAMSLLYRWASHESRRHVAFNPVERESLRPSTGGAGSPKSVRSKNVVRERVKWATPRTYRMWRDIGLAGYTIDGLRDESFRGRTVSRNRAMVEMLYGSGLRITEGSCLLLPELPSRTMPGTFNEAPLAKSIAKGGRARTWYLLDDASAHVNSYVATSRRTAVERARRQGRYDSVSRIEVSEIRLTTHSIKYKFNGQWHSHDDIEIDERTRMFVSTDDGPEPLWLWLNEAGMPMPKDSWTDVLAAANDRVETVFKLARDTGRIERNTRAPRLSPHSLRHSFALFMLIALHRSIDERDGTDQVTDYNEERYRAAWDMVRDLLGHASVTTTQQTYLAPLNGVRLRTLIDGHDLQRALRGLSRIDPRVVDVEVSS